MINLFFTTLFALLWNMVSGDLEDVVLGRTFPAEGKGRVKGWMTRHYFCCFFFFFFCKTYVLLRFLKEFVGV